MMYNVWAALCHHVARHVPTCWMTWLRSSSASLVIVGYIVVSIIENTKAIPSDGFYYSW